LPEAPFGFLTASGSILCQPTTSTETTTMQLLPDEVAYLTARQRATYEAHSAARSALKLAGKDAVHTLVENYLASAAELTISPVTATAIGAEAGWCSQYDAALALAIGQRVTARFSDSRGTVTYALFWSWDGYAHVPALYDVTQSAAVAARSFERLPQFTFRFGHGGRA
jgi:hypothetical protein